MNEKRDASTQCSEEQFEVVMNFFEETACTRQPYAAIDNPPIVPWEEMENESVYDENLLDCNPRAFIRELYEYWRTRRLKNGNQPLIPGLKASAADPTECEYD
jgi:enhancer of polycomb-like protein